MGFLARVLDRLTSFWGNNFSLTVPTWFQNRPLPKRFDYRRMIIEAYESNPLCYAAITAIADSMAEAHIRARVKTTGEPLEDGNPLLVLLDTPNDFQSMHELITETTVHMLCTGNAFWLIGGDGPLPSYVQTLPPEWVRPQFSNDQLYYEFNNWSDKPKLYRADQIVHFRESTDVQDPLLMGMPPLYPIRQFIRMDNVLSSYVNDFFYNNAVPPGLLIYKNKLVPSEMSRIEQKLRDEHAGPGNFHKIGVSFGDATFTRLGISVKDLEIKQVLDFVESRILMAFRIPAVLIGAQAALGVSASYSNYKEARASFQTENLAPRQRIMEKILTRALASKFSDNYELYFDQSAVLALADKQESARSFALDAWKASALTLDEFRKVIGYPPLGGEEGRSRMTPPTGGTGVYSPVSKPQPTNGQDQTQPQLPVPSLESETEVLV